MDDERYNVVNVRTVLLIDVKAVLEYGVVLRLCRRAHVCEYIQMLEMHC